jgi:hypothetical protein
MHVFHCGANSPIGICVFILVDDDDDDDDIQSPMAIIKSKQPVMIPKIRP